MGTKGVIIFARDRKGFLRDITKIISAHNANINYVQQFLHEGDAQIYLELEGVEDIDTLLDDIRGVSQVISIKTYRPFEQIYGKRVIIIGGGAQVSQVVLGAVTEADRHNLRGERISVDTIPLVGEQKLAEAIRAVGRLHRASILVLAGSIMGGEVVDAVKELKAEHKTRVISLNMAGGVPEVCDLVITDPVQAGVMAVMAVSDTAKFDIEKLKSKRF